MDYLKQIFLGGLMAASLAYGQNLVPNSGFDSYTRCVTTSSEHDLTPPWEIPINQTGSPDYMNSCYLGADGDNSTPDNFYGYQDPRSGEGYYGIITYYTLQEVREYMGTPLNQKLEEGKTYLVGFYVSRAETFTYVTDHIGACLSSERLSGAGGYLALKNHKPQIENGDGNYIHDAENWTLVSGRYTAEGDEEYITIGNFYDDKHTGVDKPEKESEYNHAYYFVDDVFIIPVEDSASFFKDSPEPVVAEGIFKQLRSTPDFTAANSEYHGSKYIDMPEQQVLVTLNIDSDYKKIRFTLDKEITLEHIVFITGNNVTPINIKKDEEGYLADISSVKPGRYFVELRAKERRFNQFQIYVDR